MRRHLPTRPRVGMGWVARARDCSHVGGVQRGAKAPFWLGGRVLSAFDSPAAKPKRTRQDAELGVNRGSSPLVPNPAWPVSRSSAPAEHRDTGRKACMAGRIEARCATGPPSKPHRSARPRMPAACRRPPVIQTPTESDGAIPDRRQKIYPRVVRPRRTGRAASRAFAPADVRAAPPLSAGSLITGSHPLMPCNTRSAFLMVFT